MFISDSKVMRSSIKISVVLVAMFFAFGMVSGCKKFTEPEPYNPPVMEPTMTLAQFKALYKGTPIAPLYLWSLINDHQLNGKLN